MVVNTLGDARTVAGIVTVTEFAAGVPYSGEDAMLTVPSNDTADEFAIQIAIFFPTGTTVPISNQKTSVDGFAGEAKI